VYYDLAEKMVEEKKCVLKAVFETHQKISPAISI